MDEHNLKVERRQVPRFKTALPARFKFLDLERPLTYEAPTSDIGEGGLFINWAFKDEELGKEIDLELQLPDRQNVIKSSGQVRWIKRSLQDNKILGLGIRFAGISPEAKKKLDSYIAKLFPRTPLKIKSIRPPDSQLTDREKRNLEILSVLRRQSPISKTQIAQELGLNIVTISNYIEGLRKKGIIFERGFDESSGGRRPSLLEINSGHGVILGAELNFSKGHITTLATDFTLRSPVKRSVWLKDIAQDFYHDLAGVISEAIKISEVEHSRIMGIGLGLSGSANGDDANLKELLEDKTGLPVLVEDSSVANIFAEKCFNLELAKIDNMVYIGVDSGSDDAFSMILKGELYRGMSKGKPRMRINVAGEQDQQDTRYCWLSNNCILRGEAERLNLTNAAELGMRFGVKVAYLLNLLSPEVVIVGGVPQDAQVIFFESLRQAVKRRTFGDIADVVKIIPAQLDKDSVALGMASLVCRDVYSRA